MEDIKNWKLVWRKQRNKWVAREKGGKRRQIALKTDNEEQAKMLLKQKLGAEVLPEENRQHLEMAKAHLNLVDPEMSERKWSDLMKL